MTLSRTAAFILLSSTLLGAPAFAESPTAPAPTTKPAAVKTAVEKIDVEKFDALRSDPEQVVLDVRTPAEYAEGHVPGATNVPIGKGFDESITKLDKTKQYIVYCHSGKRSFLATQKMQAAGFEHLLNFSGGIVAWENAGKPMETKAAATTKPAA